MTDLQPLTLLLGQHERQRDAAIAEHQRATQASAAATAQAEQLHAYRRDYEQRWSEQFKREGKIELVRCYQSFMERLTQAVDQQTGMAQYAARQVETALAALRECELRCASVRKLIERRTHEHRVIEERRDQKQTDEQASRTAWSRLGAHGGPRLM
jgi:flagellar FliJ protein